MCPGLESANVNGSGAGKQHFNNSRLVLRGDADEGSYHSVGISACKTTGGWHTPITTQHRIRFVFKRCCKRRRPKAIVETAAPLASCNGLGACWPEDADRLMAKQWHRSTTAWGLLCALFVTQVVGVPTQTARSLTLLHWVCQPISA